MLLIIEDKDDPSGTLAAELEDAGDVALAYIPAITVQLEGDPQQIKSNSLMKAISFEWRKKHEEKSFAPEQTGSLVASYLKAMLNAGIKAAPAVPSSLQAQQKSGRIRLSARA